MRSFDVVEWGKPLQQVVRDVPVPGPQEIVMRLSYCGVCHSDVHIREGFFDMGGGVKAKMADRGVALPLTLGHEPIGTVAAVGSDVADVHVGQTYLVNPWIGCGKCDVCLDGRDNLCERSSSMGVARPGGFSTHLVVPHARYLVDVQGLDLAQAAVLACSGVTAYSAATKLAAAQPGHSVAVLGCGGLGLMGIAVLRALGYRHAAGPDRSHHRRVPPPGPADILGGPARGWQLAVRRPHSRARTEGPAATAQRARGGTRPLPYPQRHDDAADRAPAQGRRHGELGRLAPGDRRHGRQDDRQGAGEPLAGPRRTRRGRVGPGAAVTMARRTTCPGRMSRTIVAALRRLPFALQAHNGTDTVGASAMFTHLDVHCGNATGSAA